MVIIWLIQAKDHINKIVENLNVAVPTLNNVSENINGVSEKHIPDEPSSNKYTKDITIVGFHIRRTDYASHAKVRFVIGIVDAKYYTNVFCIYNTGKVIPMNYLHRYLCYFFKLYYLYVH